MAQQGNHDRDRRGRQGNEQGGWDEGQGSQQSSFSQRDEQMGGCYTGGGRNYGGGQGNYGGSPGEWGSAQGGSTDWRT